MCVYVGSYERAILYCQVNFWVQGVVYTFPAAQSYLQADLLLGPPLNLDLSLY